MRVVCRKGFFEETSAHALSFWCANTMPSLLSETRVRNCCSKRKGREVSKKEGQEKEKSASEENQDTNRCQPCGVPKSHDDFLRYFRLFKRGGGSTAVALTCFSTSGRIAWETSQGPVVIAPEKSSCDFATSANPVRHLVMPPPFPFPLPPISLPTDSDVLVLSFPRCPFLFLQRPCSPGVRVRMEKQKGRKAKRERGGG